MRFVILLLLVSPFSLAEVSKPISGRLDNGLRYTLLPLHAEHGRIEVRVKVYAGAVDEHDEQAGVAHMLEHLLFRRTTALPNVMTFLHDNHWIRGRHYNAVTTNDSTTYLFTPPEGNLAQSLQVLSQMLFHADLTQSDLDDERKIITEEWRSGQGVGARMARLRSNVVRTDSRYTRHPVIGTQDSIATMPATQLQRFYRTWYVPNNMQLLIVGDIQPPDAEKLIRQYFAAAEFQRLPQRDYLEPKLSNVLRIVQLQDAQSAVSQIAYIMRFDESRLREQTEQGRYLRLLDKLALATVTQRLRNQQPSLPEGINSMVWRKSEIGQKTAALALFAGVGTESHRLGLQQIFTEIERLKRYPITQSELDVQKEKYQAQIDHAKQHKNDRDFAGWMRVMVETVLMDKAYLTQPELAALSEPLLQGIRVEEVNRHIQHWFIAGDRIVQYQAPRLTAVESMSEAFVNTLQQQVADSDIQPPQQEKVIEPMSFLPLSQSGAIVAQQYFPQQSVMHWTLSNGDKVVWLKTSLAEGKTLFRSRSSAGIKVQALGYWQSQLATQLTMQNAPLDWDIEQLTRWKALNKVNLSASQTETALDFSGQVNNDKLDALLRLFYAYQQEIPIKAGLDEAKELLAQSLDIQNGESDDVRRLAALTTLRFGVEKTDILPTKALLESLSADDLTQLWQKMMSAPTTYFFVNNLDSERMKRLVTHYLAAIVRDKPFQSAQLLPLEGKQHADYAMNIEPKDEVKIWYFTPQPWRGKDAVLVSLLQNIATEKLKLSLRDQHLGIYSLRFVSKLNPETHRIESELSFTANPEMTEKLISLADQVLRDLPDLISEENITFAKAQFIKAEKERLNRAETWLNRLVLSETQFGNPQYLTDMQNLAEEIERSHINAMAAKMYNRQNRKIFITTQK
ncbi:peptidase M16 [Chelonobacter oris]|uniref:Peptidase M16 n=1 Tax=Chelonobacter oris TaxID=505317 RepID=A0A0A3AMN5_9PAST|nr:M16 family metallopeptidase [Chelonobacter oris]KGQ70596.1 peptidase M16 [Chelonobacter oris]